MIKKSSLDMKATGERPRLSKGVYYHDQIIGLAVRTTQGEFLGTVHEILETGGNDVYVVRDGAQEHLLPAISQCIKEIDLNSGAITVMLMDII
jgi:16S rRNA processing protein RimM